MKKRNIDITPELIKDELKNIFVENCGDKDRDSSTCPDCELCIYFEGYEISFDKMVEDFYKNYRDKLFDKISETEFRKMIEQFYQYYMNIQ